jgi:hypothetical protein
LVDGEVRSKILQEVLDLVLLHKRGDTSESGRGTHAGIDRMLLMLPTHLTLARMQGGAVRQRLPHFHTLANLTYFSP